MLPLADDWQNYASSELSSEQLPDGKSATYGADVAKVWFRFGKTIGKGTRSSFICDLTEEQKLNQAPDLRIPTLFRICQRKRKSAMLIGFLEKAVAARATSLCWPATRHARERAPRCSFGEAAP